MRILMIMQINTKVISPVSLGAVPLKFAAIPGRRNEEKKVATPAMIQKTVIILL